MRLPQSVSGARRWVLLGLLAVLVALAGAAGVEAVVTRGDDACSPEVVAVPDCVVEAPPDEVPRVDPARGLPTRLVAPAVGIDAQVVPVDLRPDGVLVPPADVTSVGWWAGGSQPGSRRGTVLLTGHTWSRGDGVFDDLARLRPGDRVDVRTVKGVVDYRVDVVADYSKAQLAAMAERLFSRSVRSQLVLVTCSDLEHGEYHGNIVVIAHPPDPWPPVPGRAPGP